MYLVSLAVLWKQTWACHSVCTGRGRNESSPSLRVFLLSALFAEAVQYCRRRCAVRRCSNRRRTSRRRETGTAAVARPSAEPDYIGQIAIQCERCLALHVRHEFLRDRFVREFHASRFITVELLGERLGTVVITVFKVRILFHVAVVFNRQSGVSNVVPVVRIVYLGEATFPNTRDLCDVVGW